MRLLRLLPFLLCCIFAETVQSPDERPITDPRSISSSANPAAGPIDIKQLFNTHSVSGPAWSPDGKEIVFTTNTTGRLNLWKISTGGGKPVQLSQSDDRELGAAWSPDGQRIAYQQDQGGAETYDLFTIAAQGGSSTNLTNTPDISETNPAWSPDGSLIAFDSKPKSSPITNIAVYDCKTHSVRPLTAEKTPNMGWGVGRWSPDGKFVFAVRADVGYNDSDVFRIDASSGTAENLTAHQGKIRYGLNGVSPDGKTVVISSNEKGGFSNVALLDVPSKKVTSVTHLQWEASPGDFAPDGKSFTYLVNEDGRTELYLADRATLQSKKLNFPEGVSSFGGNPSAFSPQGDRLIVEHQSSQRPPDIWLYDLKSRRSQQLTVSTDSGLQASAIPPSQLVHYHSFDGKIISAFVWMPYNLKRDGSNPGIVLPHGGPTGQTVDTFNRTAAALALRGYVCIAPNPRGSTGYGMAFQKANYQDLGGGDLQDEVYGAKFLTATGYVSARKIGITGGSYGGYMTLMAIGKTPEVWAAAVEEYGIINWLTMLEHEDPRLQEYEKSLLGDPVRDKSVYEQDSPITFIRNCRAPLLVLQGDNDIRVPKEEAQQVVSILDKAGKTVAAHYYPNEGHGFMKRENQIDAIQRTIEWFDRYLKGKPTPDSAS